MNKFERSDSSKIEQKENLDEILQEAIGWFEARRKEERGRGPEYLDNSLEHEDGPEQELDEIIDEL